MASSTWAKLPLPSVTASIVYRPIHWIFLPMASSASRSARPQLAATPRRPDPLLPAAAQGRRRPTSGRGGCRRDDTATKTSHRGVVGGLEDDREPTTAITNRRSIFRRADVAPESREVRTGRAFSGNPRKPEEIQETMTRDGGSARRTDVLSGAALAAAYFLPHCFVDDALTLYADVTSSKYADRTPLWQRVISADDDDD